MDSVPSVIVNSIHLKSTTFNLLVNEVKHVSQIFKHCVRNAI